MIRFENIYFEYSSVSRIFAAFNLVLDSNRVTAVLGPSGCGKSTLVKLLCRLLKLQAGRIVAQPTQDEDEHDVKGVLFQEDTLLPWLRCVDNVVFPKSLRSNPELEKQAVLQLESVGLRDVSERRPHELSNGMKKRVEFLRALSADDFFLIADEPFAALDFHQRRHLWDEWNKMRDQQGRTCLLVTHDIDEAIALSDRIVVLSNKCPTHIALDLNLREGAAPDSFAKVRAALNLSERSYLQL